jgi:hypothetical protein
MKNKKNVPIEIGVGLVDAGMISTIVSYATLVTGMDENYERRDIHWPTEVPVGSTRYDSTIVTLSVIHEWDNTWPMMRCLLWDSVVPPRVMVLVGPSLSEAVLLEWPTIS